MLGAVLVLAQVAAAATPVPAPVLVKEPVVLGAPAVVTPTAGGATSLSDRARLIKLNRSGAATGGGFSAVESTVPGAHVTKVSAPVGSSPSASTAQDRMSRAVKDGTWTDEKIHYNTAIQDAARKEWDEAAENCRKTQGCVPVFRDDGTGNKRLKTGAEKMDDMTRGTALSKDGLRKN